MKLIPNIYMCLLLLFMNSNLNAGFGKGFAAGAGTFFGVSLLSNAIANSRQPRTVVYTQPTYPQNQRFNEIDEELEARRIEQERFFSQQAAQLSKEQQKNEKLKLEIERKLIDLERQKLALENKNLQMNSKK